MKSVSNVLAALGALLILLTGMQVLAFRDVRLALEWHHSWWHSLTWTEFGGVTVLPPLLVAHFFASLFGVKPDYNHYNYTYYALAEGAVAVYAVGVYFLVRFFIRRLIRSHKNAPKT
jgi:hypothetical protein